MRCGALYLQSRYQRAHKIPQNKTRIQAETQRNVRVERAILGGGGVEGEIERGIEGEGR